MSRTLCGAIVVAAAGASAAPALAEGVSFDVLLEDVTSWNELGDAPNTVITIDVADLAGFGSGQSVILTGLGYDVLIETFGFSWLSEAQINFDDADNITGGFNLQPGLGDDMAGTMPYQQDLAKFAPEDQLVLTNGLLRLEFFEEFDDNPNEIDALWNGTLTLQAEIPAPGSAPLLLLGIAGAPRRRR